MQCDTVCRLRISKRFDVAGWIVGLVVGLTSVILAAVLWSSRQL